MFLWGSYDESLNNVLLQECVRFNRLTSLVRQELMDLQVCLFEFLLFVVLILACVCHCQKALQGTVVMSASLEAVEASLRLQKVPPSWEVRPLCFEFPLACACWNICTAFAILLLCDVTGAVLPLLEATVGLG